MRNFRILLVVIVSIFSSCQPDELQEKRPNIIVFLVDDMGWQDTSVPFWTSRTLLKRMQHRFVRQQE